MELDLGLGVLDHQLLDSEGRRCGNVDDLELEGVRDGNPRCVAILSGPPAWRGRGRLGRLAAFVARGKQVRIPWEEVAAVKEHVELRKTAADYGLARGEERARKIVERIPGSSL